MPTPRRRCVPRHRQLEDDGAASGALLRASSRVARSTLLQRHRDTLVTATRETTRTPSARTPEWALLSSPTTCRYPAGRRLPFRRLVGVGGIGAGLFFALEGDHQDLGRDESRPGRLLDVRDYCKLHIVAQYPTVLLGARGRRPLPRRPGRQGGIDGSACASARRCARNGRALRGPVAAGRRCSASVSSIPTAAAGNSDDGRLGGSARQRARCRSRRAVDCPRARSPWPSPSAPGAPAPARGDRGRPADRLPHHGRDRGSAGDGLPVVGRPPGARRRRSRGARRAPFGGGPRALPAAALERGHGLRPRVHLIVPRARAALSPSTGPPRRTHPPCPRRSAHGGGRTPSSAAS